MKPKISPKTVNKNPGYSRLSDDEVKENLVEIIRRVMVEKERIVVELNGEEVAAIVPIDEFERLDYLLNDLKPSEFNPDEEDYYANDTAIHCMRPEQIIENIEEILAAIAEDNELFGLLPPPNLGGKKVDIFMPVAIMMSMDFFWIPDYLMAAKNELEV
ncbi:MAG: type II toxin-antitoxin system Phd/YefM family antitoxin [Cyanobacteriota bacterium]|nr:type II toxin-antitoxin system Phd/YefM family antitoxin [Cyanobacteriota bacterium]